MDTQVFDTISADELAAAKEALKAREKALKKAKKESTPKVAKARHIADGVFVCNNPRHDTLFFREAHVWRSPKVDPNKPARGCPMCHGYAQNLRTGYFDTPRNNANGTLMTEAEFTARGGVINYNPQNGDVPAPTKAELAATEKADEHKAVVETPETVTELATVESLDSMAELALAEIADDLS